MKSIALALFSLVFCVSIAYGSDHLYGQTDRHDRFSAEESRDTDRDSVFSQRRSRGKITANEYDLDSITNEYNVTNGPRAIDSLTNEYNIDGGASPYEIGGWNNPYTIDGGIEIFE